MCGVHVYVVCVCMWCTCDVVRMCVCVCVCVGEYVCALCFSVQNIHFSFPFHENAHSILSALREMVNWTLKNKEQVSEYTCSLYRDIYFWGEMYLFGGLILVQQYKV